MSLQTEMLSRRSLITFFMDSKKPNRFILILLIALANGISKEKLTLFCSNMTES